MYRTAVRTVSRPVVNGARARAGIRATPRRLASTASPADKPRSWKSSALRWGLAAGAVYYYISSPVFADEASPKTVPPPPSFDESELPTVDSVIEEKRKQISARIEQPREKEQKQQPAPAAKAQDEPPSTAPTTAVGEAEAEQLEGEAGQQGAFNPETGEINWDCPCLGGMAHGPCGEEFKTAFSCFVYSNEEPKGMDCIEKFQGMQECFRQYPDIYGAELTDEETAEEVLDQPGEPPVADHQRIRDQPPALSVRDNKPETHHLPGVTSVEDPIPTKWDDATAANKESKDDKENKSDGSKDTKE